MKKYIAYYRVSRKEQGISGLGLSAQRSSVQKYVSSQEGIILGEYTEIETGTNKRERVEIHKAIEMAKNENAILVIAKLDRLARNVNFVSSLMVAGIDFLAVDMPSANNFTIHIFSALAEQEAMLISIRTKQALAELKKKGIVLGNPNNLNDEARAKGIATIKENAINNDRNRQAQSIIISCKERGMTYRQIAEYLNKLNFKTRYGNEFLAPTVHQLYSRTLLESA
ncbi:recombinase family protein [Flavobacterium daemonense]|uniref:recombinase family protein n=1 Tax=Flavobacterium daemonense TaxID=1393049 RepID=UPI0011863F8C|nr:recombinase family protein [Flavobacterium daemonense]KAF2336314.1 recombinase family protein [Flavobacterium daemonense]